MAELTNRLILVVDDDDDIRDALAEILADAGYVVVGRRNGREALDYLRSSERPRAILLDLWMPVMDGVQLKRELESDPALSGIPVVVLTASRDTLQLDLKVHEVLTKPVPLNRLLAVLGSACLA